MTQRLMSPEELEDAAFHARLEPLAQAVLPHPGGRAQASPRNNAARTHWSKLLLAGFAGALLSATAIWLYLHRYAMPAPSFLATPLEMGIAPSTDHTVGATSFVVIADAPSEKPARSPARRLTNPPPGPVLLSREELVREQSETAAMRFPELLAPSRPRAAVPGNQTASPPHFGVAANFPSDEPAWSASHRPSSAPSSPLAVSAPAPREDVSVQQRTYATSAPSARRAMPASLLPSNARASITAAGRFPAAAAVGPMPAHIFHAAIPAAQGAPSSLEPGIATPRLGIHPLHEDALTSTLLHRGRAALARGDIAAARMLFEDAAEQGSAEAAREVGMTYDRRFLVPSGVRGIAGNEKVAAAWYRRAAEMGDERGRELLMDANPKVSR